MKTNIHKKAIAKAIKAAGTQQALAAKMGVHQSFVSNILNGRKDIPAAHCHLISELSGYPCHRILPRIFKKPADQLSGGA